MPGVDVNEYPAVKKHLDGFFPKLQNRQDQGDTPYNLRSCAYYGLFNEGRVVWSDISKNPTFAICSAGMFLFNTCYMINSTHNEYLLGVLNSCVTQFIVPRISSSLGEGANRYIKYVVKSLPIPPIEKSNPSLVSKIQCLANTMQKQIKNNNIDELGKLNSEIDRYVCELYQLSANEQTDLQKFISQSK